MLARIRKAMDENEGGFTLIELLVVIIIIGILAAIAIPVFLNQRQKGYDAQTKSDLRNVATQEESFFTDYNHYAGTMSVAAEPQGAARVDDDTVYYKQSPNAGLVTLNDWANADGTLGGSNTDGYCIEATS